MERTVAERMTMRRKVRYSRALPMKKTGRSRGKGTPVAVSLSWGGVRVGVRGWGRG